MTFPADVVGLLVTAVLGLLGAIFVFKKGKDTAKKEVELKAMEEHNEAVRVVNEVKQEVAAEIDAAPDDHLVNVARRWLRSHTPPDSKPN